MTHNLGAGMVGSPWKVKAVGGGLPMVADPVGVREALKLFADAGNGCELMALRSGVHRTLAGGDLDGLCKAVGDLPSGAGIYFRVNPVPPGIMKPATNKDIVRRRWIYIDVDPVKADGQTDNPATDDEKERTAGVCDAVADHLAGLGWPPPVVADSGNGHGMFYPCDLPNDKRVQALLRQLLRGLAGRFNGPDGEIDDSVHNANRLAKLPGTWARKGVASDDRPHRVCRLLSVPAELEPVTLADLEAAAGMGQEKAPPAPPRPWKDVRGEGSAKRIVRHACAKLGLTRAGQRNNTLNRVAFSLGGLVGAGLITRAEVEAALYDAACRCGLDTDPGCGEKGIRGTIERGIEAGSKEPWTPATGPQPKFGPINGQVKKEPPAEVNDDGQTSASPPESLTVSLANITPLEVEWLMKNRIAKRFITVMAGRTGIGKSFVTLDLIARISRGAEIPFADGECFPTGGALIISEDSHEYVLAPRLIDADARMSRIHAMTWKAMTTYHLGDTDMLSKAADEVPGGVSVVLIDPPTNFTAGTDGHVDSDIRQLVMRVVEWALSRDVAVLFILHVNKQAKGVEALNRVMGSVAWVTTSRIAHTFCPDPNDREQCLWVPMKNNLGPLEKAIAYRIEKVDGATRVTWLSQIDTTADEAMGNTQPRERRDIVAAEWLLERFRDRAEWESEDLFEAAKQEGVSRNAIFEAKRTLNLPRAKRRVKENGDEVYVWWVSPEWLAMQDELAKGVGPGAGAGSTQPSRPSRDTGTPGQ